LAGEPESASQQVSVKSIVAGGDVLTLYINTPLLWTQAKRFERSFLT
jgi:hypothetical protein